MLHSLALLLHLHSPQQKMAKLLIASTAAIFDVQSLEQIASTSGHSGAQLQVLTQANSLSVNAKLPGTYDAVVLQVAEPFKDGVACFGALARCLQPSGSLTVILESTANVQQVALDLKLAGLLEPKTEAIATGSKVTAQKPAYEVGATAAISLKSKPKAPSKAATWAVTTADDDELIDEDELLTEDDKKKPTPAAASDCDVGAARKACKNCTCGRADAEKAGVDLTPDMDNPQSACGSCGLGDAFRCATCPYKGLPPFELGKKVQLKSDFLAADI